MAGALIKIDETIISSALASVTLTGIDSTYDVYKVVATNIKPASDDKDLYMKVTVSGSAQTTSNYDSFTKNFRIDASFSGETLPNVNHWQPFSAIGGAAGENANLVAYLFNFNNSSEYSYITVEAVQTVYDLDLFGMQGGKLYTVAEAHDGVNFTLESGTNFSAGQFTLYGLKK